MEDLKPIEKLYLISKEEESIFSKKNRLYCLIYQLIESKNILVNRRDFNVSMFGDKFITPYEEMFLNYIHLKKYSELDSFINNLSFDKTLLDNGYLKSELKESKSFFVFNTQKLELKKTAKYFEFQAKLHNNNINNSNILRFVCPNIHLELSIIKVYNLLTQSMQKTKEEQEKKDKESNKTDFGNMFGINEKN